MLEHYGIKRSVHGRIRSWLTNRLDEVYSIKVSVRSGVPLETVLGPLMFLIYINNIGESITSNLRLFADNSLLYLAIETQENCLTLQEDLNRLSQWASTVNGKWHLMSPNSPNANL